MPDVISMEEVLRFGQRHYLRILTSLAATVATVLLLTFLMTPTYEATSLLLVKFGREYLYRPEPGERDAIPNPAVRDRRTLTELLILRSKDLAASVVTSVGVNRLFPKLSEEPHPKDPRKLAAAAQLFSANLIAEPVPESDVIRLRFRHSDPDMTAKVLNLLVDQFKEKHLKAFSDPQATQFLRNKVAQYRDQLTRVEEELKALQLDTRSFSLDDHRAGLFQQRRDLEAALKEARNRVAGLKEKLAYLQSEKEKASTDSGRTASEQNRAITDARAQLLELELQEQKLLASFNETSRNVVSVRRQVQLVKDFLEKQKTAIGQGEFAEELERQIVAVVAELRFQEARRDSLIGQLTHLEGELGRVPDQAARYRDLVRQRETAEKIYQTYSGKLEEARISEDMDSERITNITVIQSATVPVSPIWPSTRLNLLIGLILGTLAGVGWAFASEQLAKSGRRAYELPGEAALAVQDPAPLQSASGKRM